MANAIIMPKQGLQMTEGTITEWLKNEGDTVKEGEPLFEMETDKLTISIDSTASGTLLKILHAAGDVVPITETIAVIGAPGENVSGFLTGVSNPDSDSEESEPVSQASETRLNSEISSDSGKRVFASPRAKLRAEEKKVNIAVLKGTGPDGLVIERDILEYSAAPVVKATPLAKKVAEVEGVELSSISGSGSHGKVTSADIYSAKKAEKAAESVPEETVIPVKGIRKVIAERMKASLLELAQANHRMTADMTEAVRLRDKLKDSGVKVSYNDIVIRCVAKALTEFPMMNSSMTASSIILKHYVNVGMAVATDNGLLVPVIKNADKLTLPQIAEKSAELARQTKENAITPDELTGGTFTVTNLGMFDVESFTAIINAPEAGILAVGKMQKQAVVLPDDTIAVRPMMQLSLTYDHRIVDGAPAAQFLRRIKQLLEAPQLLI